MYFRIYEVFIVAICLHTVLAIDLVVSNLLKMQQGIGWPRTLHVTLGHEALIKIGRTVENVQACEVTTPLGETFDVRSPPNNRYESWSEGCGLRVQNVRTEDEGRWRLSVTGNTNLTGWTELHVEDDINSYSASPISLLDGETHRVVELTSLDNSYCLVAQPFAESSLVSGHCRVTLDRANRAVQGDWEVLVGLPGRVSELQVQRRVNVEAERLDVGYIHNTNANKLHIYCNVIHTMKNITFCRFQMATASFGYNVMDGLSDGIHSYYGDGFAARHCGMTVENPTSADYGTWRCSVGLKQWVGTQVVQQPAMQALVRVLPHAQHIRPNSRTDLRGQREVIVEENITFTLMCNADVSLSYCWFQHPNGTQFTPVAHDDSEQEFWYTGTSLQLGECGITFSHAAIADAGQWTCHMGPNNQMGVEITDSINLRVTGPLAADIKEVDASIGASTTLYCRTANGKRPLHYCRFLAPNRVGISIDSTVTSENAILDRYYFTPDRELYYGDCSLDIDPVRAEDIGEWTCAAQVDDHLVEGRDTIVVRQASRTARSHAGIIGMSVGVAVVLIMLIVVVLFKRGILKNPIRQNAASNMNIVVTASRVRPSNFSGTSNSSQDSEEFRAEVTRRRIDNEY